ncbi:interleukin-34 isoform X2 [Carettochelys insculpta]|uniref:interleukin-34 isoform X2 n=1 Tax=Carettochelys insculpta TaxID=44489 RepID=UPI003EBA4397
MQRGCAPVLCVLAVLGLQSAVQEECTIVRALRGKLAYQQRLQYTRHYFPINYTVNVHFHEVLRAANVSSLGDPCALCPAAGAERQRAGPALPVAPGELAGAAEDRGGAAGGAPVLGVHAGPPPPPGAAGGGVRKLQPGERGPGRMGDSRGSSRC